jgi:S-adenosylmethionine hydrolase
MAIITLTTDLGLRDNYVASVKGAILKEIPDITIVDITHEIPSFDLPKSAFVLRNCYQDFPDGTIHIVGVNSESNAETPHIAVLANGHYFIGADNGVFSLIFDNTPKKIVELTISQDTDRITFPTKDVFVKAACHIARGGTLEVIGIIKKELLERTLFRAVYENNKLKGMVVYVDHYGNLITNISESSFKEYQKGRSFTISFRKYGIRKISKSYCSVHEGEKLALFSSSGFMEISINKGHAKKLLMGLENDNNPIIIEFHD